ncbi:hypothetical protein QUF72_16305 [Desulfobacterales bacterium HSG2]|nr:hypothetical protein [Desulfobacterales bacterium HSG2]
MRTNLIILVALLFSMLFPIGVIAGITPIYDLYGSTTTGSPVVEGSYKLYRLDIPSSGTLTVWTESGHDTYGYLLDSDQSQIASDDDDGPDRNFEIQHQVTAGRYHIKVEGYSGGAVPSYTVHVDFSGGYSL